MKAKEYISHQKKMSHNKSRKMFKKIVIDNHFIWFFFYENNFLLLLQTILINLKLFLKYRDNKLEFFRDGNFFKHL